MPSSRLAMENAVELDIVCRYAVDRPTAHAGCVAELVADESSKVRTWRAINAAAVGNCGSGALVDCFGSRRLASERKHGKQHVGTADVGYWQCQSTDGFGCAWW